MYVHLMVSIHVYVSGKNSDEISGISARKDWGQYMFVMSEQQLLGKSLTKLQYNWDKYKSLWFI